MNFIPKINLMTCLGFVTQNTRNYAAPGALLKKAPAKKTPKKVTLEYETDTTRLTSYVCGSNINKTGEDIKLKDDAEYPDWLWKISMDEKKSLENLSPDTVEYWRLVRKQHQKLKLRQMKEKRF